MPLGPGDVAADDGGADVFATPMSRRPPGLMIPASASMTLSAVALPGADASMLTPAPPPSAFPSRRRPTRSVAGAAAAMKERVAEQRRRPTTMVFQSTPALTPDVSSEKLASAPIDARQAVAP